MTIDPEDEDAILDPRRLEQNLDPSDADLKRLEQLLKDAEDQARANEQKAQDEERTERWPGIS